MLIVAASVIGLASIITSNGGGGGGGTVRVPLTVDYTVLPTAPLAMSTSAADTSVTDEVLAGVLRGAAEDLNSIGEVVDLVFLLFSLGAVTTTETQSCIDGGTETLTVNVAQPGLISAGDSFSVRAAGCVESGETRDGTTTISIVQVGSLNETALSREQRFVGAEVRMTSDNAATSVGNEFEVLDGSMSISADQSLGFIRFIMAGTSIAIASNTRTMRQTNFEEWTATDASNIEHSSINYTLADTALGGVIQVATLTTFDTASVDLNPSAGVMTVTGAAGNGVKLTALDATQAQLDYEFNGNGLFDDHTVVKSWPELTPAVPAGVETSTRVAVPQSVSQGLVDAISQLLKGLGSN
jgi:hypothetical protein